MTVTLHLGDCLEYMKTMESGSVDAVITDPPYGFGQNIVNVGNCPAYVDEYAWNDAPPTDDYFDEIFRISKNQIIFGGNYFPVLWRKPCRGFIFWDKIQCSNNHADGELIWTSFNRNAKQYRYCFSGNRFGWENSIHGVGLSSNRVHPTQKPTDLMTAIIQDYLQPAYTIFDPFMGSGTTGVAAVQLGRNFIGCEIDPKYFAIAEKRIHEATLQPQLFPSKLTNVEEKQGGLL